MGKTHLIIPDQHAHPDFNNDRADWLGEFIKDLKPDVVINMGDAADFSSLSSYDKGKRSFHGRTYKNDLDAHLDFQERMFNPLHKSKKRLPRLVVLEGNHERRIEKALDLSPELQGTVSFNDLDFSKYYHDVVRYEGGTPGVIEIDGIRYAHYFVSGIMGRNVAGEHPAYSLLTKQFHSCTQGHTHTLDYCVRTSADGKRLMGLVCGVFQDYNSPWAGVVNSIWWRGLIVKRNVVNGQYDPEFISINSLKKEYEK